MKKLDKMLTGLLALVIVLLLVAIGFLTSTLKSDSTRSKDSTALGVIKSDNTSDPSVKPEETSDVEENADTDDVIWDNITNTGNLNSDNRSNANNVASGNNSNTNNATGGNAANTTGSANQNQNKTENPSQNVTSDEDKKTNPSGNATSDEDKQTNPSGNATSDEDKQPNPSGNANSDEDKQTNPSGNAFSDADKPSTPSKKTLAAKVKWTIKPCLEAEDMLYMSTRVYYSYDTPVSFNQQKVQLLTDYALIKDGDRYDLVDMDGNLITDWNIKSFYPFFDGKYCLTLYDPMSKDQLEESYMGNPAQSADHVDFDTEESKYYFVERGDAGEMEFYYAYDGEIHDMIEATPYADREFVFPDEPIPVQEAEMLYDSEDSNMKSFIEEKLNGKYAIWCDGAFTTDFIFEELGSCQGGLFAAKKDGKWGYVDKYGKEVIPFEYDASWENYLDPIHAYGNIEDTSEFCYAASSGYVPLVKDGVWELRTTKGKLAIAPGTYDKILPVYKGKCWVKKDGSWGQISVKKVKKAKKNNAEPTPEPTPEPIVNYDEEVFTVLGGKNFTMSSGVGSWGTDISVDSDGCFQGEYHDSNVKHDYYSYFHGHFWDTQKLEENRYRVQVTSLTVDEADSDSTGAYGLENCQYFDIYFPGYPVSMIDANTDGWFSAGTHYSGPDTLDRYCIVNTADNYVFLSYN